MKRILLLAGLALAGLIFSRPATAQAKSKVDDRHISWQPQRLVNGSPVLFEVRLPSWAEPHGKWLGHDVFFSFDPERAVWYGMAGVSLETKPGVYTLQLATRSKDHVLLVSERKIAVARAKYPSVAVTVARKFTEPDAEQVKEIDKAKTVKADVFAKISPDREWTGAFRAPVEARISDVFGTRRTFNGKTQSMHQGLDYAVGTGTPVHALNSGTVLLAQPLYFEGNCVVLDHGQGLLSIYMHLSEFKVKAGDHVHGGQEIALSGGSGRATGPHLHVAVRWQSIYLNPAAMLHLSIP